MSRRQKEIFAHNNKYERNIFKRIGRWFGRLRGWQKGLIIVLILVLVIVIGLCSYVFSKLGMMDRVDVDESQLSCVDVDGYVNILLLGVDSRDMENIQGSGADAIMILSIKEETGEVKLMSVYRDTYMKMGDTDSYDKITNANRIGGPQMMMTALNQAMDLNISKFVVVNFKAVADLVDAVGGVTVDVQEEEISQLNKYTIQTANNIGQTSYDLVEAAGEQTLEGVQAVSYGRIRKGVGDDYKRTERMRTVLTKVFEKLKTMSVKKLDDLLDMMLPQVQTNLSNSDLLTLAMRLANFNISSGAGWPYDVTSGYIGQVSYVFADDLLSNTVKLHQEMFGQTDYSPSDMVVNMNSVIAGNISASVTNQQIVDTASGETTDKVDNQQEDPVVEQPTEEELSQQKPSKGETGETGGENSGGSGDGEVVTPTPDPEPTPEPEVPDQAEDSAAEASTLQTES